MMIQCKITITFHITLYKRMKETIQLPSDLFLETTHSDPPDFITHPVMFCHASSSYQQSFYPRSIKDWNNLPSYLIECDNFDSFSAGLHTLYITYLFL